MSATELAFLQTYRQRRERVVQWLRTASGSRGGVAIVPTAPEAMRNRDSDYPYRHDSYFYYLTGFTEPEAVLAIVVPAGNAPARSVL
ncbi:aminopeptidase P N-terminal domain-containing protein, partial [Escherichia coli]|nr:aminopeptidase P N-terminal domain-containing protein [Escherichia coli]